MRSQLFGNHLPQQSQDTFTMQNPHMLKVRLANSSVYALTGSMVAYQGEMKFDREFAGVGRLIKESFTHESMPLMEVKGSGDVYVAHDNAEIHLVYLEDDSLTVNGMNIIAFDPQMKWDIKMVHGVAKFGRSGWFNVEISGTGWAAITAHGTPVVLQAATAPTYADFDAAVAWSSGLETSLHTSFNMKSLFGWGSGEAAQMSFKGDGVVVVQASEGAPEAPAASSEASKK
jgi:uncharacterized protein (AIM24 family)